MATEITRWYLALLEFVQVNFYKQPHRFRSCDLMYRIWSCVVTWYCSMTIWHSLRCNKQNYIRSRRTFLEERKGENSNSNRQLLYFETCIDLFTETNSLDKFMVQVHLIKLEYCFCWQLLREMQIKTFGTLYSHFGPYHAHCVCPHIKL